LGRRRELQRLKFHWVHPPEQFDQSYYPSGFGDFLDNALNAANGLSISVTKTDCPAVNCFAVFLLGFRFLLRWIRAARVSSNIISI
jgi:hypothetical protein